MSVIVLNCLLECIIMEWLESNTYFLESSLQVVSLPPPVELPERSYIQDSNEPRKLSCEAPKPFTTFLEQQWMTLDPLTSSLAQLLSLFAPKPISWHLPEATAPLLGWQTPHIDDARMKLYSLGFLDLTDEGDYEMPAAARSFVRMKLEESTHRDSLKQAVATAMASIAKQIACSTEYRQAEAMEATIPHLAIVAQTLTDCLTAETIEWCFIAIGSFYVDREDYQEAQIWYERGLSVMQARYGSKHPAIVTSFNNLAYLLERQGQFEEAEPLYLKALELGQQLLGNQHLNVATSLNNLASLYRFKGDYSRAESLYLQALAIREKNLGEQHLSVAASLNNLAGLYYSQGRYDAAELLYVRALRLRRCLLGDEHPTVATSLNNLATTLYSRGRFQQAVTTCAQAVQLSERVVGVHHPDTIVFQGNLETMEAALRLTQPASIGLKTLMTGLRRWFGYPIDQQVTQDS